jgi:hypothetical protein
MGTCLDECSFPLSPYILCPQFLEEQAQPLHSLGKMLLTDPKTALGNLECFAEVALPLVQRQS